MRTLALIVVPLAFVGCVNSRPRVATVPSYAWRANADSPRTLEPVSPAPHRDPVRPAPSVNALSKEQVLTLANAKDPQDAIAEIDRHPLAFPLTNENVAWFEDRVVPPELVDYLRKRAAVDWEALNRPAPQQPEPERYATWEQAPAPAQEPSTVYYVSSPQPRTTVVYNNDPCYSTCGPTYTYGSTYYSSGYAPTYYAPSYYGRTGIGATVYVGGSVNYGRSYVRPRTSYVYNYNRSSLTYRPGVPSGVFPHQNRYVQPQVRTNTIVRGGNPTVIVQSRGGRGGRGR